MKLAMPLLLTDLAAIAKRFLFCRMLIQIDGSTDIEQIIVLYAGFAAQKKYGPDSDKAGSSQDDAKAERLLKLKGEKEADMRAKALSIVEENWPIIEAIAGKLLKFGELQPDEWSIIIDAIDEGEDWENMFNKMRYISR